jgi:hypothetical protein
MAIASTSEKTDRRWEQILRGDHPVAVMARLNRRFFALFPSM